MAFEKKISEIKPEATEPKPEPVPFKEIMCPMKNMAMLEYHNTDWRIVAPDQSRLDLPLNKRPDSVELFTGSNCQD